MDLRIIYGKDDWKYYEITEREVDLIADCVRGEKDFVEFHYNRSLIVLTKQVLQSHIIEITKTDSDTGNNPEFYF